MKPREMYSGAAPAAMGMMGQGLAEVGANIARTTQQGYQQMGQSIGQGLQAVGQAYADYKQMDSEVKAKQAAAKTLLPYLPQSAQKSFKDAEAKIASNTSLGLRDKKAFYDLHMNMLGNAVGHAMAMEKVAAETTGKLQVAGIGTAGALALEDARRLAELEKEKRASDAARIKGEADTEILKGFQALAPGAKPTSSAAPATKPVSGGVVGSLPAQGGGYSDVLFGGSTGAPTTGPSIMTLNAPTEEQQPATEDQQAPQENDLSLAWFKKNNPDFYNRIVSLPGFSNWDQLSYQNRKAIIETGGLLFDNERPKEKSTSAWKSLKKSYKPASQY